MISPILLTIQDTVEVRLYFLAPMPLQLVIYHKCTKLIKGHNSANVVPQIKSFLYNQRPTHDHDQSIVEV